MIYLGWEEIEIRVKAEAQGAAKVYGPYTSSHEGLGVLTEEIRELENAIHGNDLESVRSEAIQVAAVAMRLAACCGHGEFDSRSGFGS